MRAAYISVLTAQAQHRKTYNANSWGQACFKNTNVPQENKLELENGSTLDLRNIHTEILGSGSGAGDAMATSENTEISLYKIGVSFGTGNTYWWCIVTMRTLGRRPVSCTEWILGRDDVVQIVAMHERRRRASVYEEPIRREKS